MHGKDEALAAVGVGQSRDEGLAAIGVVPGKDEALAAIGVVHSQDEALAALESNTCSNRFVIIGRVLNTNIRYN